MNVDLSWLVGRQCTAVHRDEFSWNFIFDAGAVTTPCLWRLIDAGRIRVTSEDHGQQFGLPAAVDARAEVESRLVHHVIQSAKVRADTGDLILEFGGELVLELLQTSSGYEAWQLTSPGGEHVIAMGGGDLAIWQG
ncbi:MAG: DUF6188 family protein [Pyrinomonadaceae bacterium]